MSLGNTPSRRQFLRATGAVAAGGLAATSGCLELFGLGDGGGSAITGSGPTMQDIRPEDADVVAETAGALLNHAAQQDGRIIWIPSGTTIDLTGRDLTLRNVTVASGRSDEQAGAVITTQDEGASSPTWSGGSGYGLISMEDNARVTGVELRGPHTDVTDHEAIPGYFPFAPGSSSARRRWRRSRFARAITITGDNCRVDNSEIWGWSVQGIAVGPNSPVQNALIAYCSIHNTLMTSYGYCVDVRHGDCTVYRCYLDAARHAICGSGMADANYNIIETTFGPWATSHQVDHHRVGENVSGSPDPSAIDYRYRAGGTMLVRGCTFMVRQVPDLPFINHNPGGIAPHVKIRGVPSDGLYFENNICAHADPQTAVTQNGVPGRYSRDSRGYVNINIGENVWGEQFEATQAVP